jgi:hypothetical protein
MSATSRTIAFVLPGRRTLSEHLPAEIIDVSVSIIQRSASLRKLLVQHALRQPSARQIALPNVDPVGFRLYVEWLQTGRIEYQANLSGSGSGMLLRDAFDLVFAHIVGSQLGEPDFQDYIIDTIARLLDTSQTPDLRVLEVVFLEKGAPDVLKQFVVDRMFAMERKMLGMMRGGRGDVERKTQNMSGCDYHVHKAGECYKQKLKLGTDKPLPNIPPSPLTCHGSHLLSSLAPQLGGLWQPDSEELPEPDLELPKASSVRRKTVPPRGTDWLKQYDRINSMMKDVPPALATQSKKSRFQEMLRNDSRASGS